jgi:Uma2 family endonuclease
MSTTQRAVGRLGITVEEYVRLEEASPERNEWVAGRIYALSGASKRHNRIVLRIATHLIRAAGDGPCVVYASEVKLRASEDAIYYPDVMVACGPGDSHTHIEDAPCLIVEVISPSTGIVDRREKRAAYKRIPTLQAYLIVDQEEWRVERHWRKDGEWWEQEISGEGVVPIPCPECELSLAEIYEGL